MELAKLIYHYNELDNKEIGEKLLDYLNRIENFYYSPFWIDRFKRRCKEENLDLDEIDLCILLGSISTTLDCIKFRIEDEDQNINGSSKYSTVYINITESDVNNSHIYNLVIHEIGHILYSHIPLLKKINKQIFSNPKEYLKSELNQEDYKYFTDTNELRQRIFPVIVEMIVNNWDYEQTYFNSQNLIQDSIYKMYDKNYIIYLLKNII